MWSSFNRLNRWASSPPASGGATVTVVEEEKGFDAVALIRPGDEIDNPLNGNMYKPIYFNEGQAVHGAGYIPPELRSKGCARTFPGHQDAIVSWLGLDALADATLVREDIGVTVVVPGRYQLRD